MSIRLKREDAPGLVILILSFIMLLIMTAMGCWLVYERTKLNQVKVLQECLGTVTATAYTPCIEETDSTPNITANGSQVFEGGIAISRDLREYLDFGDMIFIPELNKTFIINDIMNSRYKKRVDIFMFNKTNAKIFGKRTVRIFWIKAVKNGRD